MRNLKIIVWIVLLFLVQTVLVNYIKIAGARPDLILPFVLCVALMEDSFKRSVTISVVCAVLAASLCGRNFTLALLFYTYMSIIVFNMRTHPRYMPDFAKYMIYMFIGSVVLEGLSYIMLYSGVSGFGIVFLRVLVFTVLYDIAAALVIYPIVRKTVYKSKKKQLIIE